MFSDDINPIGYRQLVKRIRYLLSNRISENSSKDKQNGLLDHDIFINESVNGHLFDANIKHPSIHKKTNAQISLFESPFDIVVDPNGFSSIVLKMIDERQWEDADVYKAAGIDRRVFSKLRSNKDYQPKKSTALAITIGLQCSIEEATLLLQSAGYSFSRASGRDVIVYECLAHEIYDIFYINQLLEEHLFEPFDVA